MSKLNPNVKPKPKFIETRLAGGFGAKAARQGAEALLRRAVLACLLWEDMAYESGVSNAENIASLIPQVDPVTVTAIAIEARTQQKLRHVPLYIASEMLKHEQHKKYVGGLLPIIITRPDQITDMLAIYWKQGKKPLANQLKKGLAACFAKFDEYQLAKYDRDGAIKLRDAMFLTRPKPIGKLQTELFKKIADRTLTVPDTWEVALSAGNDKRSTFTRLINEGKLGAFALLRNLRNMMQSNVDSSVIRKALKNAKSQMLLPTNFIQAAFHAPEYKVDLNEMMLRTYANLPKLPGRTILVIDVSGSMNAVISAKSELQRWQVAAAMGMLALEQCEEVEIWCTGGDANGHRSARINHPARGFALIEQVASYLHRGANTLGGNGIYTRRMIEYLQERTKYTPDRIIVFSDSQDVSRDKTPPKPFGVNNYIVDVSAHKHGVNYKGAWSAEVSGWSESFLTYIAAMEGLQNTFVEE